MGETTIVTSEGDEGAGAGELGTAAVAAAALSGAAAANANDAKDTADEAARVAASAQQSADRAESATWGKPDYEEARRIAREESVAVILELDELKRATDAAAAETTDTTTTTTTTTTAVDPQVLPPSVASANGKTNAGHKRTLADRWHGITDDDE